MCWGLIGCVGTPALTELSKSGVLVEASLASIAPFTGAGALLRERNIFPVRASYETELERLLRQAAELHQKRVAIIWWKAGVGPLLSAAAAELAPKYQVELTANIGFEVAQDKAKLDANINEATKVAAGTKPDAVLIVSAGQSGYQLVRSIKTNLGGGIPVYSISALAWKDVIKNVGIDVAKGLVISQAVPFPYSGVNTPIVKEYLQDIAAANLEPDYASLEGYLGGRIAALAVLRIHGPVTRDSFLKAISSLGRFESGSSVLITVLRCARA
jgi:branched-chain amino acid transport system substrate-binding protein